MLQWGCVEGEVRRPELPPGVVTPQDSWTPAGEDADAGPSTEVARLRLDSLSIAWRPWDRGLERLAVQ